MFLNLIMIFSEMSDADPQGEILQEDQKTDDAVYRQQDHRGQVEQRIPGFFRDKLFMCNEGKHQICRADGECGSAAPCKPAASSHKMIITDGGIISRSFFLVDSLQNRVYIMMIITDEKKYQEVNGYNRINKKSHHA